MSNENGNDLKTIPNHPYLLDHNPVNEKEWWNYKVSIKGPNDALDNIDHVEYSLFPDFTNTPVKSSDRKTNFQHKFQNFDGVKLNAKVVLKSNEEIEIINELPEQINSDSTVLTGPTTEQKLALITEAREVLRGKYNDPEAMTILCRNLERCDQFAYATEVLLKILEQKKQQGITVSIKEFQTLAKYIYKDHSLPSSFKFERALDELNCHEALTTSRKCETMGLAGAIYKRIWQYDHQFKNLVLSRFYYKKGYTLWKEYLSNTSSNEKENINDDGYTAINYAYINELMAIDKMEEHGLITGINESIEKLLKEADITRKFILDQFTVTDNSGKEYLKASANKWIVATIAEAYFGLRQYDHAIKYINKFLRMGAGAWEIRTFSQQLFSIAYLQTFLKRYPDRLRTVKGLPGSDLVMDMADQIDRQKIDNCLKTILGYGTNNQNETSVKKIAKTGLGLSGGGFRASIYHIGVLASLAEHDELKNIEVISCVSGGSIIGAFYYLKLKQLLETKSDTEIKKADYINLVHEIEEEFLNGVQKNLRIRIFGNLVSNFRMLYDKNYSRTHRLGELYEKHLYEKIFKKGVEGKSRHICMTDLTISPKDQLNFNIAIDNWQRINKIPQLILNATSLNTGHNWQFTASWMGEPPGSIQPDIDVKPRLRRMYYGEAPPKFRDFRLGYAVGASSCVPVMFHPMPMKGLYPDVDLHLVDGGLHDNQGIGSLIEQECKHMIISDASGQLPTNSDISTNSASIFYRSDNIVQERVRELQFKDIKERSYSTQIDKLVLVHLKKGLEKYPVKWANCDDPTRQILYSNVTNEHKDLTDYGILRSVQTMLSEIRTDLDSFNDTEAYALMYSGYCQMNTELERLNGQAAQNKQWDWKFLKIRDYLRKNEEAEKITKILSVGKNLFFKLPKISTPINVMIKILLFALLAGGIWLIYENRQQQFSITVLEIAFIVLVFMVGLQSKMLANVLNTKSVVRQKIIWSGAMIVLWIGSNLYTGIFNGIYNRAGRLKKNV